MMSRPKILALKPAVHYVDEGFFVRVGGQPVLDPVEATSAPKQVEGNTQYPHFNIQVKT